MSDGRSLAYQRTGSGVFGERSGRRRNGSGTVAGALGPSAMAGLCFDCGQSSAGMADRAVAVQPARLFPFLRDLGVYDSRRTDRLTGRCLALRSNLPAGASSVFPCRYDGSAEENGRGPSPGSSFQYFRDLPLRHAGLPGHTDSVICHPEAERDLLTVIIPVPARERLAFLAEIRYTTFQQRKMRFRLLPGGGADDFRRQLRIM